MQDSLEVRKPRIVVVLGDGAIRAGFVAGAIGALLEDVPELLGSIGIVYGSSASAGNAIYLASFGKDHPGERMWNELLADKAFIKKAPIWSDKPIYDIEYLVEDIFRGRTPVPNANGGVPDTMGVVFPALELGTSTLHYFANRPARSMISGVTSGRLEEMEGHDIYRLIGAASAAPFVYDRPFVIDNWSLIDAAALAPSIDDLVFNVPEEVKFIYIFCRKPPNLLTFIKYFLNTWFFILFVRPFRKVRYPLINYVQYAQKPWCVRRSFQRGFADEKRGRGVVIYPKVSLGDIDDNSPQNLKRNYDYGGSVARSVLGAVRGLLGR